MLYFYHMSDKKLKIDDSINIETHSHLNFDAAGEQRHLDEKFYTREKSILETSAVYVIIGIGVLIGLFIFFRIQSYHGAREKEMIEANAKRQQNEKQKRGYIAEVNALRNSVSEMKGTDVAKYAPNEIEESENNISEAEAELKKYNFVKVEEIIKKTQDKLDEASAKTKRAIEEIKGKNLAKQKDQEEKRLAEEEKQKQAEKERKEKDKLKQREEALKKLQELEKIMKK